MLNNSKFDSNLEGLRGYASLLVVLGHVLTNNFLLDLDYRITGVWQYTPPGHLSVLIFFTLSGYVIGLTNKNPIVTNVQRASYLKKRFVRLYPLYLVSIVLAIVVAALAKNYFSFNRIGLHLLFGQVLFTPVLDNNQPLWSLSYEMVYYLLFLILSAYKIDAVVAAVACVGIALIARFVPGLPHVLVSYSFGACFWFAGLAISTRSRTTKPLRYGLLLAWMLLILCYERMNLGYSVLTRAGIDFTEQQVPNLFQRIIGLSDLSYLLFCIVLLFRFTDKEFPGLLWVERIIYAVPGLYLLSYVVSGKIMEKNLFDTIVIASIFYILSILVYLASGKNVNLGKRFIEFFVPLGSISYGIYITHFPLIFLFQRVHIFSGTTSGFLLKCFVYVLLVLSLGWFLERKFQPWAKARLV